MLPTSASVEGSVRFRGKELLNAPESELRNLRGAAISMVWQEPASALNPVLPIGMQIDEVIRAHRDWPRAHRRAATRAILERVRLPDPRILDAYPHQLSGGELQRVVLAQALVCEPALLVADEPASSLDTIVQAEILKLLASLARERRLSVLFITHNPALLTGLAARTVQLRDGRMLE